MMMTTMQMSRWDERRVVWWRIFYRRSATIHSLNKLKIFTRTIFRVPAYLTLPGLTLLRSFPGPTYKTPWAINRPRLTPFKIKKYHQPPNKTRVLYIKQPGILLFR